MMRVTRSLTAVASAALLALGGVALAATSASAAEEDLRPGAQSPTLTVNSALQAAPQIDSLAQQFVQPEDGNLATFTIQLWDTGTGQAGYDISSAAVHVFTPGVGPGESPIEGGLSGSVTFESEPPANGDAKVWATFNFPDRPMLVEGERYAVVIGTRTSSGENASFGLTTPFDPQHPDFYPWVRENGIWVGHSTTHTAFTSQLTTVTETPDPEVPGETPGGEEPGGEGAEGPGDESPGVKAPVKPKAVETGVVA